MVVRETLEDPRSRKEQMDLATTIFLQGEEIQALFSGKTWPIKRGTHPDVVLFTVCEGATQHARKILRSKASCMTSWAVLIPSHALAVSMTSGGTSLCEK